MRQIGTVATEHEAQRLVDVLLTEGIKSQAEPADAGWSVWVYDEDRLDRGRSILERFRANPDDPAFVNAADAADRVRAEIAQREAQARKNIVDVRSRWTNPGSAGRPLTILLILISVGVSLLTEFGQDESPDSLLEKLFFFHNRENLAHWEVWRFLTPIFLHFNPQHLLFNMLALYAEGSVIEIRRGTPRFAAFVLFTAVVSNTAQFVWNGPSFGGMSGVCFGLFGYVWIKSKFDPGAGIYISSSNVIMMLFWLVLCMTGSIGPIANAAHVAGLIAGIVVAGAPLVWRKIAGR